MQEQVIETVNTDTTPSPETSGTDLRKMAEMQATAYTQLVNMQLDRLMSVMVSTNKVSFQNKLEAARAVKEAVSFALDFGLGVTNSKIRNTGHLAKETNELAAVLVKAFDNRMLLLADNLRQNEENKQTENITEV